MRILDEASLPAEWHLRRAVLMAFPHLHTDWLELGIQKALSPFIRIAQPIAYETLVLILCDNKEKIVLVCSRATV